MLQFTDGTYRSMVYKLPETQFFFVQFLYNLTGKLEDLGPEGTESDESEYRKLGAISFFHGIAKRRTG